MRGLTVKQKKLLDKWYDDNKSDIAGGMVFDLAKCDLFPYELLEQLEEINDTEVLYRAINAYIRDKFSKDLDKVLGR